MHCGKLMHNTLTITASLTTNQNTVCHRVVCGDITCSRLCSKRPTKHAKEQTQLYKISHLATGNGTVIVEISFSHLHYSNHYA